jgi:hypothetical protein
VLGGNSINPIPSFADGVIVQQVIEAVRASAAGAGWIRMS